MGRYRALMTETDREHITGESNPTDQQQDQSVYRVRQRIHEELPKDIEVLSKHRPDVLDELLDEISICRATPAELRLTEIEEEVPGSTEITLDVTEMHDENQVRFEIHGQQLGKKYRIKPETIEKLKRITQSGAKGTLYVGEETSPQGVRDYPVRITSLELGETPAGSPCIVALELEVLGDE